MNRPERSFQFLWSFVFGKQCNAARTPIIKMFKYLNGEEWPSGMVDRKSNMYYC